MNPPTASVLGQGAWKSRGRTVLMSRLVWLIVLALTLVAVLESPKKFVPKEGMVTSKREELSVSKRSNENATSGKSFRSLFLHVPKAGGTVLANTMEQCLAQKNLTTCPKRGEGRPMPYDHVCERELSTIHRTIESISTIFLGGNESHSNCHFLETHYDYSLVDKVLLQSSSFVYDTFTMLRDPVERELSAWRYQSMYDGIVKNPSGYIADEVRHSARNYSTLSNYTKVDLGRQKYGREHNHMTRQLAGVLWRCSQYAQSPIQEPYNDTDRDLLARAKTNLKNLTHVFIYEELQHIPRYLEIVYGCNVSIPTERFQSKQSYTQSLTPPPELLEEVERHNPLDRELYECGKVLWRQKLQQQMQKLAM